MDNEAKKEKRQIRSLYAKADKVIGKIGRHLAWGRTGTLKRFLDVLAQFPNENFLHQLLITQMRPNALRLTTVENWWEVGQSIVSGARGVPVIQAYGPCDWHTNPSSHHDTLFFTELFEPHETVGEEPLEEGEDGRPFRIPTFEFSLYFDKEIDALRSRREAARTRWSPPEDPREQIVVDASKCTTSEEYLRARIRAVTQAWMRERGTWRPAAVSEAEAAGIEYVLLKIAGVDPSWNEAALRDLYLSKHQLSLSLERVHERVQVAVRAMEWRPLSW